jgi:ArsR family transcriptional regulator
MIIRILWQSSIMNPLQFYKCLADETRLRCLLLIHQQQELCVCELTTALEQIQPKISRHLSRLKSCDLLTDRRQGQWVFYRINPQLPQWCLKVLNETVESNADWLALNRNALCKMGDRPQRQACCG